MSRFLIFALSFDKFPRLGSISTDTTEAPVKAKISDVVPVPHPKSRIFGFSCPNNFKTIEQFNK